MATTVKRRDKINVRPPTETHLRHRSSLMVSIHGSAYSPTPMSTAHSNPATINSRATESHQGQGHALRIAGQENPLIGP